MQKRLKDNYQLIHHIKDKEQLIIGNKLPNTNIKN